MASCEPVGKESLEKTANFWLLDKKENRRIQKRLVTELANQPGFPAEVGKKLKNILEHIFYEHKHNISHIVVQFAYKKIKSNANKEELELARVLGVCFQICQWSLLMIDDYADQSDVRYGNQTWHTLAENVNDPTVIYDFLQLEKSAMTLIHNYFGHMGPTYYQILNLLTLNSTKVYQGNFFDAVYNKDDALESCSIETWRTAAECKLGYWSMYLPVSLALTLDGFLIRDNVELFEKIETISKEYGIYFQRKDDYLDCFAEETFDSMYMDVKKGKCSWLTLMARDRCIEKNRPDQWQLLKQNYGKGEDDNCVEICKNVFVGINLPKLCKTCNEEQYQNVEKQIAEGFQGKYVLVGDTLLTFWKLLSDYPF